MIEGSVFNAREPDEYRFDEHFQTNLELGTTDALFGRVERLQKNAEEIGFAVGNLTQSFDIKSIAAGYARTLWSARPARIAAAGTPLLPVRVQ
jgi:hypothetical protein